MPFQALALVSGSPSTLTSSGIGQTVLAICRAVVILAFLFYIVKTILAHHRHQPIGTSIMGVAGMLFLMSFLFAIGSITTVTTAFSTVIGQLAKAL